MTIRHNMLKLVEIFSSRKNQLLGGIPVLLLGLFLAARWLLPCQFTFSCPADEYNPKLTFQDYCEDEGRDYKAPWNTVKVLLQIAQTEDCEKADKKLQSLNALYLEDRKLESLAPLSHMTQLIFLNARKNAVSDLRPLSQLTNLISLKLETNKVTDINPIKSLVHLQSLDLSTNPLKDIRPLSELVNLAVLRLDETEVDDITALRKLSKLQTYDYFRGLSLTESKVNSKALAALGDCSPSAITSGAVRELCQKTTTRSTPAK